MKPTATRRRESVEGGHLHATPKGEREEGMGGWGPCRGRTAGVGAPLL
jgi:hypothetical protein